MSGLKALYSQDVPAAQIQLQKTKKEFEGHLTLVVFPFLRMSKKGPEQTAQEIGEYLQAISRSIWDMSVIICWAMRWQISSRPMATGWLRQI